MDQRLGAKVAGSGELESLFGRELRQGEKLLWTGWPSPRRLFRTTDATRLVVGLIFSGAVASSILWDATFLRSIWTDGLGDQPMMAVAMILFTLVFIVAGVGWLGLGGVYRRAKDSRRLRYAITDHRVIFADIGGNVSITSVPIERIPGLSKKVDSEGFGIVALHDLRRTDLESIDNCAGSPQLVDVRYLRDIPHADEVYSLLSGLIGARARAHGGDAVPLVQSTASEVGLPSTALPPRTVGAVLAAMVTLGNPLMQFGILWLGFVMVFVRIFCSGLDMVPIASVFSGVGSANGVVTSQETHGWKGSEDESSGRPIVVYTYTFRDQGGRAIESSFRSDGGRYKEGEKIPVEYAKANPRISRIAGLDAGTTWGEVAFLGLFVAAGMALVVGALVMGARALRLLRSGRAVVAEYRSTALRRSGSSDSRGDSYSYDICYEFATPGGPQKVRMQQSAGRSNGSEPPVDLDPRVHVPQSIIALYDPANPSGAMALPSIPGDPRLDRQGCAYSGKPWKLILYLVIPTIMLVGHGVWWYVSSHG